MNIFLHMQTPKQFIEKLLKEADVLIDGPRPWDIQVHNEELYARILRGGSLAFGESYMDGWWDAENLDETMTKIFNANLTKKLRLSLAAVRAYLHAVLTNQSRAAKAFEVGEKHYDIGNDLFERMLDKRMAYTCGYWKNAQSLDQAQEHKLDLICKKIDIKPGQRILDIGCGWGSFAKYAAEHYGASVVGITISKEQVALARERCVGHDVEIRLQDYRDVDEQFDHIISIGMFEHVGYKNYRTYLEIVHRCLKDNGLFLLHTIGGNTSVTHTDPWIDKYIFANSMLPSIKQISNAAEKLFVIEDWHNFGTDYDKTLMAWYDNFISHWDEINDTYSERFFRMWEFYLLTCAGSFRSRKNQLWQIVMSKNGVLGGYTSIR